MKFGVFHELQLPRPWMQDSEYDIVQQALDQIELTDKLGVDCAWVVEHQVLEEYSHSSAPEVFPAASTQRTKQIRIGHGINLTAPQYNPQPRVAVRVAMLDLLSNGRVEWGSDELGWLMAVDGFGIDPKDEGAMWREGTDQAAYQAELTPYFAAAMAPLASMPKVMALGGQLQVETGLDYANAGGVYADKTRGGSIPAPMSDPARQKPKG